MSVKKGITLLLVGISLISPITPNFYRDFDIKYQTASAMTHTMEVRYTNTDYGNAMWVSAVKYVPSLGKSVLCSGYIYKISSRFDFSTMKWVYTYSGELRPGPYAPMSVEKYELE